MFSIRYRNNSCASAGFLTIMGPFFLGISGLISFWFGGDLFGLHFLFKASGPVGFGSIVEPSTRGAMLVKS